MPDLNIPVKILGIGRYLPERRVSNEELARLCGRSAHWIEERNGVRERRYKSFETNAFMGARAAENALADADVGLNDIDLILNASGTAQQSIPDNAVFIQRELGERAAGTAAMTLHATCLSFLAGFDLAASLLLARRYRTILLISSDIASVALNPEEAESFSLFGDGAAAVVLSLAEGESSGLHRAAFKTFSEGAELTTVRGGGTQFHPNAKMTRAEDNLFHMDGLAVLRLVRRHAQDFLEGLEPGLSAGLGAINLVIPHQASKVGLRSLERYNWPREKIVETLSFLGNCISASLPLTLYEAIKSGRLERGDRFLMVGTGAGLSMGGLILTY
ncbi:MAG: hypothetical protein KC422_09925 [Trueperaceae bacterium]|nr:hypothetical protein [Trueperaceae bacterium]